MNRVAVSTLPMDMGHLTSDLLRVSTADRLHVDIMDGSFVQQETFGTERFDEFDTDLVLDVHLMIDNPADHVAAYADAGGDIIVFHYEAANDPGNVITLIHDAGARAGMAINPETDAEVVKDYLDALDTVMVMGVHPGKGGQTFIPDTVDSIRSIRSWDSDIDIEVDGGINEATGEKCVDAGATTLCSGSYVFSFDEPKLGIDILRNL